MEQTGRAEARTADEATTDATAADEATTDATAAGVAPPRLVGPVLRGMDADLAQAVIAAVETDNPGQEVHVVDRGGYIRVHTVGRCRLTQASLEAELGQAFPLSRLEPALGAFAGRMSITDDEITWYLARQED
ncbi:MmoB/DmpM family protein [Streptomyces sp. NPDC017868]|uniref:MmoB/DmpM family protein n=1 Tax=Streptomyces sp. NPDC017868 TaxID=3365014 RepID=UPI0037A0A7FD